MAKNKSIPVKKLLEDVGLGFNTMSNMKTSMPKADNIAKIADYLGCSIDYLLGRTDIPEIATPDVSAMTAQELNAYIEEQSKNRYDILGSSGKGAANVEIPPEVIEKLTKANEKTFCLLGEDKCTEISESEYKKLLKVLDAIRM